MMLKRRRLTLNITLVVIVILFVYFYHEKVLTKFDDIFMPISLTQCDESPNELSKNYKKKYVFSFHYK
jgi:hypothetical protein